MSSYAGGTGEALPWWAVLVEGIVVALFGLLLLVAPGASLSFLVLLLGIYLLIAGIGVPPLERTRSPYATLACSILPSSKSAGLL